MKSPSDFDSCLSLPMNDGGMASIKIVYIDEQMRGFGALVSASAQIDYLDDATYVNITLLIDKNFIPRELDCFVSDFSVLKKPLNIENIKSVKLTDLS